MTFLQKGRALWILLAAALLGLAFTSEGCRRAERSPEPRELVFIIESDLERLDPTVIRNPHSFRVAWQIYEGLLGLSPDGRIEPRLAESWETEDFQTWRFVLRRARFHDSELFQTTRDGREVEAEDVVFSYTSYCAPGAFASFILADSLEGCAEFSAGEAQTVEGLRIIDDRTVELRLREPEPFFLHRISSPWAAIVPRESAGASFKNRWGLEIATGTGPYRLSSRTETEVILDAHPHYWDSARAPEFRRVVFRVVKSAAARVAEVSRGEVDVLPVSADLYDSLLLEGQLRPEFADSYTLEPYTTFNHHLIGFNTELMTDVDLRMAMHLATDRQAILDAVRAGFGLPLGGPVPPTMAGYTPLVSAPAPNLARARQVLAASDYEGQPLELLVHDLAGSERVGEIFQQQMRDLGVEVTLRRLDYGSMIGRVINGEAPLFSMFAEIVFSSPEPLLLNLFSSQKVPVPNFWRYSNPEVDEHLARLRSMGDRGERFATSARIERQISEDVPAVFLYSETPILLHSTRLHRVPVSPNQHFLLEEVRPVD